MAAAQPQPASPAAPQARENEGSPSLVDASTASDGGAVTRTVKDGDYILSLVGDVYGYRDKRLLDAVRRSNPHIRDLNLIRSGDLIVFPKTDQTRPLP